MPQHQDPLESHSESDNEPLESDLDGSDEELIQVRTALVPAPQDATPEELRQVLIIALVLASSHF